MQHCNADVLAVVAQHHRMVHTHLIVHTTNYSIGSHLLLLLLLLQVYGKKTHIVTGWNIDRPG
jgi:hypothetical protein